MSKSAGNSAPHPNANRDADFTLTRRTAAGDIAAARELIYRLMERVHATCDYLANGNDGADLAQTALMEIVRSAGSFRNESTLDYWADRVTVRTAAKLFSKRDRRRRIRDALWVPGPENDDVEHQADLGKVRQRLRRHLLSITEDQRLVVVLHYLHDYEVPKIADLVDARINTVRSRLARGLKRLRRRILADPGLAEWIREGNR